MEAITFENVEKRLGDFTLSIPKLAIKQGYITGFIGKNGAGKTTTIKGIMNLLNLDQGHIKILGKDSRKERAVLNQMIGYVGDKSGYMPEMSVETTKNMIAPFYKNWDESLFEKYIKLFGLHLHQKVGSLSQGQGKQMDLVMALAHRPKLIVLDEPTANLDPIVRNEILDILMEHMQNEEVSVFYSTHITTDLEKACDYIMMIQEGKILFSQDKESIEESYYLIKGSNKIVTDTLSQKLIGFKRNEFGFEGLTTNKKEIYALLGEEVVYDKANLEDIMVFLERGKRL